jgi:4-hydroxybenzoate polyprenyltransferase
MTNSSGTRRQGRMRALIRSSHPGPCLAITAMTVLLAAGAGAVSRAGWGTLTIFTVAVLAGQLSIGWSNDAFDADLDAAAGRTDKPIVAGTVSRQVVLIAAGVALVVSFLSAFAISIPSGLLMVPVVGAGWAYNAGLKATVWSGLMYVLGFGPIPALATSVLPGSPSARPWSVAAASLLGLGAHFANVLPDLATDRAGGVRGLPQRVAGWGGERSVRLTSLALLVGASALIAWAPGVTTRWPVLAGLGAAVALALVAVRARGRTPFLCALGIAGIDVLMFLLGGADLY